MTRSRAPRLRLMLCLKTEAARRSPKLAAFVARNGPLAVHTLTL
jgi:hypothetical protein